MSRLLILGAGGHGRVVGDAAHAMKKWQEICYLDDNFDSSNDREVVGGLVSLHQIVKSTDDVVAAVGDNKLRANIITKILDLKLSLATIIHPDATVSPSSRIGNGTVIFARVVINANAEIGVGCIINTGAIIEHDCTVQEYVHVSPGAILAGNVRVGKYSWLGMNSSVINNLSVGDNVIVGAGSVVLQNVQNNIAVAGVPARRISSHE